MSILTQFASAIISPLGTSLAVALLALWQGLRGRRRWSIGLGTAAIVWLWVWSLPAVSETLRAQLEQSYPPVPIASLPDAGAIVVLGGGVSPAPQGRPWPGLGGAADRVWHAARLYHAGKAPLIVLSGGSDPDLFQSSEAEAMRLFLLDLGVPDSAMLLEERSRSTLENARFSLELIHGIGIRKILLVTSATHMDRALIAFKNNDTEVIPAACDHESPAAINLQIWYKWLPDTGALAMSATALKEAAGRLSRPNPQ